MGEMKSSTKGRMELEELYSGIPDESVNLTFQDFGKIHQEHANKIETIQETKQISNLNKLPSLDFSRGLQATMNHNHNHNHHHHHELDHHVGHHGHRDAEDMHVHGHHGRFGFAGTPSHHHGHADDMSMMSMNSTYPERGGTGRSRRPGIPHSNICTVCTTYVYIFKHRCLVCGRVYCRNCAAIGMGEMTEGRKCIECLGRRFSQRYIKRAGKVGCCSSYASTVKQAEMRWAEKGPRRSGERAYGHSTMVSRSVHQTTPTRPHLHSVSNSPSFVASPYSPHHHHLPL
ncbi:uncharacterized protein LOC126667268 [Mercurialis annua]|uniref:uncharacterized protein LOC126667268 n=1 Tax=Mercurialis annua TaxID=3986 RepID=UPI00215E140A|nr:uncharacterized protein LOC126667268 [Mercurialis annua]